MTWINRIDVAVVLQRDLDDDPWIDDLILQVQGLCEIEIGEQEEPVPRPLAALVTQITARHYRAGVGAAANPAGFQTESIEDYTYTVPTGAHIEAGLGLTKREKADLRRAVGRGTGLWVQPTTRGPVETPGPECDPLEAWDIV